jgi:predicted 3-demethylubiquinone-9 3-methyltransferase (glyoxalase superfamily)
VATNVTPFLWFKDKAHDAAKFYCSIFKGSKVVRKDGMSATVRLQGRTYILFNGGEHYRLTPAFSMFITVKTQKEVDYYWNKLLNGGQESRCGWLVDKYGLSWQVIPEILGALLSHKDRAKSGRAMQAMLEMRKIDIKALKQAASTRVDPQTARQAPAPRRRTAAPR